VGFGWRSSHRDQELAEFDLKQLASAQPGIAEKLVAYQPEFYLVIQARDSQDFTI
jgi:hypothetical protein